MRLTLIFAAVAATVCPSVHAADPFMDGVFMQEGAYFQPQQQQQGSPQAMQMAAEMQMQQQEEYSRMAEMQERAVMEQQEARAAQEKRAGGDPSKIGGPGNAPSWANHPYTDGISAEEADNLATMQTGLATGAAVDSIRGDRDSMQHFERRGSNRRGRGTRVYRGGNRYNPEPRQGDANGVLANPYAAAHAIPYEKVGSSGFEPPVLAPPLHFEAGADLTLPNYRKWVGYANPGEMDQVNMAVRGGAGASSEPTIPTGTDRYNPLTRKEFYSGVAGAITGLYNPDGSQSGPTNDPHPWELASPNEHFYHAPSQMYDPLPGPSERVALPHKYQTAQYRAEPAGGPGLVGRDGPPVDAKAETATGLKKKGKGKGKKKGKKGSGKK